MAFIHSSLGICASETPFSILWGVRLGRELRDPVVTLYLTVWSFQFSVGMYSYPTRLDVSLDGTLIDFGTQQTPKGHPLPFGLSAVSELEATQLGGKSYVELSVLVEDVLGAANTLQAASFPGACSVDI